VTTTPLPTWGDAADLIDILDVRPDGERRYTSVVRGRWTRPVVEGSQMLGQAVVAACRHCPGRRVVSAHMVFHRSADASAPLHFALEEHHRGRSFAALSVDVSQDGRSCAAGTLLLGCSAPDVVRHAVAAPAVPAPDDSEPCDMGVTGREIRVAHGAYTGDPDAPIGPPTLDAWVRFTEVPPDPPLHAGLLAQFTGHMPIAAALRPHAGVGQDQAHRSLSMAINAIAISFHAEVRADRWMLYHHHSTFAGDGMTHAECRVHDEAGRMLASFSVDAMVRPFDGGRVPVEEQRAL
jgi:acyl-CoA thioesterase II